MRHDITDMSHMTQILFEISMICRIICVTCHKSLCSGLLALAKGQ